MLEKTYGIPSRPITAEAFSLRERCHTRIPLPDMCIYYIKYSDSYATISILHTVVISYFPVSHSTYVSVGRLPSMNPGGLINITSKQWKGIFHVYKPPAAIVTIKTLHRWFSSPAMPARTPRCFRCLIYGSLHWEEKVNCFSMCPFERPPEAVQDIKSSHVRSHYASSSLVKHTSPATHTGLFKMVYPTAAPADSKRTISWLLHSHF